MSDVLGLAGEQHQVTDLIIPLVPVDMVYDLSLEQWPLEVLGHNHPVLPYISVLIAHYIKGITKHDVAFGRVLLSTLPHIAVLTAASIKQKTSLLNDSPSACLGNLK